MRHLMQLALLAVLFLAPIAVAQPKPIKVFILAGDEYVLEHAPVMAGAKREMTPWQQQVFDAQMAVGDPARYAEFAGNVVSIDTRPMCKPANESPGGRDRYAGNAASYLLIGNAMAEAMIQLNRQTAE